MSGSLGEWSIEDLLQIARITHKTTCIEIEGPDRSGTIFLSNGAIVDASVEGSPELGGSRFSQVVEAIETLAAMEEGSFEFSSRPLPSVADRPIEVPAALAAMEKDAIREKRLTDLGVDLAQGLAVGRHIDGAVNLKPAVWQLLADLIEPFSLESLQIRMGRRKAVATLLTLDALGVLERRAEHGLLPADAPVPPGPSSTPEALGDPDETEDRDGEPLFEPPETTDPGEAEWGRPEEPTGDLELQGDAAIDRDQEPIVEIFTAEPRGVSPAHEMHEVVAPSETTLVSDVLGDMRSRFRHRGYLYEEEDLEG